jgi:hypothetical protein
MFTRTKKIVNCILDWMMPVRAAKREEAKRKLAIEQRLEKLRASDPFIYE